MHFVSAALTDFMDPSAVTAATPMLVAGAVPVVLMVTLALFMLARRAHRAEHSPVTQLAMGAPVSRKQVTELRGPRPALEVIGGHGQSHDIGGAMVRIGRHPENDIQLDSQTVHRHHAVLHVTPREGHVITDVSGPEGNGVMVNGNRVDQAPLAPGDVIELGDVTLRFRLDDVH